MKVELTTIHIRKETKDQFHREASLRGLKIYAAADEALRAWMTKGKKCGRKEVAA